MTSCGVLEFRVRSNSKVQIFEPSELLKIKTHIKLIYNSPQQIGQKNLKIQNSNQHYTTYKEWQSYKILCAA